ncbi:MAG: hypothetical protein ABW250_22260, partial [Pyrinomonadaceae bacterium]
AHLADHEPTGLPGRCQRQGRAGPGRQHQDRRLGRKEEAAAESALVKRIHESRRAAAPPPTPER